MPLIQPQIKVEIQLPAGTIERLEARAESLYWSGFLAGAGLVACIALFVLLWRRKDAS